MPGRRDERSNPTPPRWHEEARRKMRCTKTFSLEPRGLFVWLDSLSADCTRIYSLGKQVSMVWRPSKHRGSGQSCRTVATPSRFQHPILPVPVLRISVLSRFFKKEGTLSVVATLLFPLSSYSALRASKRTSAYCCTSWVLHA